MDINLLHGDCLIESDKIESGSVDLILTDLPYGNMDTDGGRKMGIDGWDKAIPPKRVYEIANRILRKNGKMVLFSQEPYTGQLTTQAIPNVPFSYRMIWQKDNFANALLCNKAPVSYFEDILVFSKSSEAITCKEMYGEHPLVTTMKKYGDRYDKDYLISLFLKEGRYSNPVSARVHVSKKFAIGGGGERDFELMPESLYNFLSDYIEFEESYFELKEIDTDFKKSKEEVRLEYLQKHNEQYPSTFNLWEGNKYKSNILKYRKDYDGYHPTQKPVLLLEDLAKTFSNDGDLVVDLTMGSGSTGVACVSTNRNFIGIELDDKYFEIAKRRISEERNKSEQITMGWSDGYILHPQRPQDGRIFNFLRGDANVD